MINLDNAAANLAALGFVIDNDGVTLTAHKRGSVVVVAAFEARVKIGRTSYALDGIFDAMPVAASLADAGKLAAAKVVLASVGAAVI
jgi:hypothetical protein